MLFIFKLSACVCTTWCCVYVFFFVCVLTCVIIFLALLLEEEVLMSSKCSSFFLSSKCDRGVAAWLGSCSGGSTYAVLQNDVSGRDLSPYASQSHQVLQCAQINGAESWLCRAVHHVCLLPAALPACQWSTRLPSIERRRKKQKGGTVAKDSKFFSRLVQFDSLKNPLCPEFFTYFQCHPSSTWSLFYCKNTSLRNESQWRSSNDGFGATWSNLVLTLSVIWYDV